MSKMFASYQGGGPGPLPPGYMQAATSAGRSIADGLQSMGQSIGQGLQQRHQRKQQRKGYESYLKHAHGIEDDQLSEMSLGDLQGLSRAKEGELLTQERQQQMKLRQGQLQELGNRQESAQQTQALARGLIELGSMTPGHQLHPKQVSHLMKNFPKANVQQAVAGAQSVQPKPDGGPEERTLFGQKVGYVPKTGAVIQPPAKSGRGHSMTKEQITMGDKIFDTLWKTESVKEFKAASGAYQELEALLESESTGPGDIGMIFKFMKALDPRSVVREGEFATAENAGGIPVKITNFYNKLMNGERLPQSVREEFVTSARAALKGKYSLAEADQEQLKSQAKRNGVPLDSIAWIDFDESRESAPASNAATGQFKPGQRVRQNGRVFQFDGTSWNPVP